MVMEAVGSFLSLGQESSKTTLVCEGSLHGLESLASPWVCWGSSIPWPLRGLVTATEESGRGRLWAPFLQVVEQSNQRARVTF